MTDAEETKPAASDHAGWAQRWQRELTHAREWLEESRQQGREALKAYLDERPEQPRGKVSKWNLFHSSEVTQQALMYGQVPRVSVERRFADPADDVARVAGEMWERALNSDVEKDTDTYAEALGQCLEDFRVPGLGVARVRYVVETEKVPGKPPLLAEDGTEKAPAVPEAEEVSYECVDTEYVHWEDFLYSPAKVWSHVRWVAFKAEMSKAQLEERFKEAAADVPMRAEGKGKDGDKDKAPSPWARADVWEIWDKDSKAVYWYVEGHSRTLDMKPDPYGLPRFFPCPRPMMANTTTSKAVPKPNYLMAKDLYEEINVLSTRIRMLVGSIRVVGAYDKSGGDALRRMVHEAHENDLIPVDNWAAFAEKGGIKGQVDWMPIDMVVGVVVQLMQVRQTNVDALYQITGMSDIMRGQASAAGTTATEQRAKVQFGSVRMQALQAEFARFATDLQRLKSHIMATKFQDRTILEMSNIEFTPDKALAPQAIAMMRSHAANYRVEVKPEAVSMQDFAAIKSERMEVVGGMAQYIQAIVPMVQLMPGSLPELLEAFQWVIAGMRGASGLESVLDRGVAKAQKAQQEAAANPQGQQPDPKVMAQQMKGQQDQQKVKDELQADLVRINAEVQADAQREQTQAMWNTREAQQKALISAQQRAAQPQVPGRNGRPT